MKIGHFSDDFRRSDRQTGNYRHQVGGSPQFGPPQNAPSREGAKPVSLARYIFPFLQPCLLSVSTERRFAKVPVCRQTAQNKPPRNTSMRLYLQSNPMSALPNHLSGSAILLRSGLLPELLRCTTTAVIRWSCRGIVRPIRARTRDGGKKHITSLRLPHGGANGARREIE